MGKWKMVRLGDVCEILDSQRIPITASDRKSGIYPYYGANGVQDYVSDYIFNDELVLLAEDGGNFGSRERPIAYRVSGKCWVNNHAHVLKAKQCLNTDYLCRSIMFYDVSNLISGTTRAKLNQAAVRKMLIPLPPLDEQKRIAKNLDFASDIVKGYKEQLAELDKLVQSVFYEMFGDPVTNEKGWDREVLSKTAQIITGNTPPRNCKDNYGNYVEWIKTDNITDGLYVTQASEYLSEEGAAIGRLVDADSILMACIAGSIKSIGRVAITNRTVAFNQQINAVIADKYDTLFLYWLFKMSQGYIQSTINMSLKGILSKGKLEKLTFILPPLPLQTRFASIVTEIEAQKAQVQQALTEAENLFNSLMQEYFE